MTHRVVTLMCGKQVQRIKCTRVFCVPNGNEIISEKRTAFFWVIMQRIVVIGYRNLFFNPEDGTDRLSRNVGKKPSLLAA
jgi:hypothetical protein